RRRRRRRSDGARAVEYLAQQVGFSRSCRERLLVPSTWLRRSRGEYRIDQRCRGLVRRPFELSIGDARSSCGFPEMHDVVVVLDGHARYSAYVNYYTTCRVSSSRHPQHREYRDRAGPEARGAFLISNRATPGAIQRQICVTYSEILLPRPLGPA